MSTNGVSTNGINKHSTGNLLTHVMVQQPSLRQIMVSPGNPPWSETVLVTPDVATHWLGANTMNRRVRKSRVKSYARDMAAGRWLFNTQGVSFATDGSLIDGQHRLLAVIQSGATVHMVVWFNVPATTRSVIDIGDTRSLSDIANLTNIQAAVTVAMMRGLNRHHSPTMSERESFYLQHAAVINGVIGRFPAGRKKIMQANVLGAICRASFHISREDVEQFCSVLVSGVTVDRRDASVIRLRDRLLQTTGASGAAASREVYALTAAALRAFSEGRAIAKIYPASTDPFPLPTIESAGE